MKVVRVAALTVTSLCLAWAIALFVTGGFDIHLLSKTIASHDARRPILFGSVALTIFILAGGGFPVPLDWFRGVGLRIGQTRLGLVRIDDRWIAGILTAATLAVGLMFATMAIGGSDSYGYVSEADLLLQGKLTQPQPWVAQAPWPAARWSFTPLGYHPQEGADDWDIMPIYAPGLPLLMAGAKAIGGECAMFVVVPLLGAIMVLATYGIGRRLGSPRAGVIASFLVATSPAFLFMLVAPMTDVAVAGAWTAAFYFLLGSGLWSAAAAGLFSAIAILIRPNLVFLAAVLGTFYLLSAWRSDAGARRRFVAQAVVFALCTLPGMLVIAGLNWWIRGSPLISGYGGLDGMFAPSHILPNIALYTNAFVSSQTPIALAGLAALIVPLKWMWPRVADRLPIAIGAAVVLAICAEYFPYLVFDDWWYLRFFLTCWPFVMLGLGSLAYAGMRTGRAPVTFLVGVALIGLGVRGVWFAADHYTFELCKSDHKYVAAAQLVQTFTDENSVIVSMQHSGSIRYYGGRMTLRFDGLEPASYDTAMTWLAARGVHAYALLEDWELPMVKERFAGQKGLVEFDAPPAMIYQGAALIYLFDLQRRVDPYAPTTTIVETYRSGRCALPAPPPHLVFKP